MTILQKPDELSMSENIKSFRISSSEKIIFVLKQGEEEILSQVYDPGQDRLITIDIRDIVHSRLSFTMLDTSLVYQQDSLVSTFTANISGTDISFRVIRAGVDRLADTTTNFLTHNFLTWQPSVKPVTYYSPEFLTYYSVVVCHVKLRAYFTSDSDMGVSQTDIDLYTLSAGNAYTIPLQYAIVAEKLEHQLPAYYDVWIENNNGERLTYIQRYYASDMHTEQEQWILFENSLGGIDTFRAYGVTEFTGEHTHNVAEIDDISIEYRVDTERKFQKNTGHLNAQERKWLLDFFPSCGKYIYAGTYLRSIVLVESNVTYTDRELPSNYTFTYKYADAKPLLNLPRTDIPPDVLDIIVPSVGSFTVPPRLVEFPRLPLSEGALFPVQNPYSESWGTSTAGSLGDFIAERLSKNYGDGGGVGHHHDNIDLLQLLSYVKDYLLVAGKKINAGYADKAGWIDGLEDKFLRKDKEDSTLFLMKFLAGIEIGDFVSGLIGACIDEKGYAELAGLKLREFLEAPEYRFNRVDVVAGELWNAVAFGLIESVDTNTQIVTLKLEESELSGIHLNDFCRGIFHNQLSTSEIVDGCGFKTLPGFSTSYFTPVEILDNGKRFRYTLKSGTTVHPCKAMKFVVYGNPTDKSRQASAYSTRTYKRYLTGVNTWDINPNKNIAMQFGDCSGLNINGKDLSGYSAYLNNVYITGVIKWLEEHIDELKGKDGYSVSLSSYDAVIAVNSNGEIDSSLYDIINIVSGNELVYTDNNQVVATRYKVQTTIQALRGNTVLAPSDTIGEGKYLVSITPKGCEYNYADGVITITKITQDKATLEIEINCEGMASFINTFTLTRVYGERGTDGNSIYAEYSSDGNVWHATFTEGDIYMRQRIGDGKWSLAYRIVGETGDAGVDGRYTDYQFAVNSSLTESPVTGWQDTPPTVAVGQYLWMRSGLVTPPLTEPEKWTSVRIGGKDGDDGKDGDEAYSVSLSSYDTAITLNNKGEIDSSLYDIINIVAGNELVYAGNNQVVTKKYKVQTSVYAFHGATKLEYADIAVAGKYSLTVTAYGCEYLIADGVITVTKITQDKASLDIVINCENKITVTKTFTITRIWNGQDANLLPWVDEWNSNKTEIGGDFFISPKMFSGTRDEVTGKLTGVASGRDCITIDGVKHTGIFGIVDDEIRFTLDPLSKKFIFKGEVHADSGTFNNVYVNGFVASSFSDVYDKTAENIPSTMNYIVKTDSGLDFFLPNSDKYIGSVLTIYLAVTITGNNNVRIGNSLAGGAGVTYKGWSVICLARYPGTILRLMATGRNGNGNLNWEIINYTPKRFSLVAVNNDTYIIDRAVTALEVDKSGMNSYSELLAYWDTL